MNGEERKTVPKKGRIHVGAAALVDLKSALFRKQTQFKRERTSLGSSTQGTKPVSDKTSAIWRDVSRHRKKKVKGGGEGGKAGREQEQSRVSAEEEAELAKSRRALEAKAVLYEKLSRGEGLRELEEEEEEGEEGRYMVDFTRKIAEQITVEEQTHTERGGANEEEREEKKDEDSEDDDDWVEYVDSFGRSRKCLKEDLPHLQEMDRGLGNRSPPPDLLSEDMRRERARVEWEREALRELGGGEPVEEQESGPVHYQDLQQGEIRNHGVGYYAFSTDKEQRKDQMDLLNKLREQTADQREKRQKLQDKRKALLEARLARVREKKLKQKPATSEGGGGGEGKSGEGIADFDFGREQEATTEGKENPDLNSIIADQLSRARERVLEQEEEERAAHVRPWDRGKVVDPIRKRKQELRDERESEFAPPSTYFASSSTDVPKRLKLAATSSQDNMPVAKGSQDQESQTQNASESRDPQTASDQQQYGAIPAPVPPGPGAGFEQQQPVPGVYMSPYPPPPSYYPPFPPTAPPHGHQYHAFPPPWNPPPPGVEFVPTLPPPAYYPYPYYPPPPITGAQFRPPAPPPNRHTFPPASPNHHTFPPAPSHPPNPHTFPPAPLNPHVFPPAPPDPHTLSTASSHLPNPHSLPPTPSHPPNLHTLPPPSC